MPTEKLIGGVPHVQRRCFRCKELVTINPNGEDQ
jgi:hypothetical protein